MVNYFLAPLHFFVLVHLFAGSQEGNEQCRSSNGCTCVLSETFIDISHAFNYPIKDIADSDNSDLYSYQFSPCDALTQCTTERDGNRDAAVCQIFINSSFKPVTLGLLSSAIWTIETVSLYTVTYTDGEVTFDNFSRQSQVHFTMDPFAQSSSISFLGEKQNILDKTVTYSFQVTLARGHDASTAGVIGFVAIAFVIVIALLYLAIGSVYNYTTKHVRGVEALPNYVFWRKLPSLVKDGCCFVISPCKLCQHKGIYDYGNNPYHSI